MGKDNKITNYKKIKSMKLDDFAKWLDEYCNFEDVPWMEWFDKTYCSKCEPEKIYIEVFDKETDCSYCEVYNKCKYFNKEMDTLDIIKRWLRQND